MNNKEEIELLKAKVRALELEIEVLKTKQQITYVPYYPYLPYYPQIPYYPEIPFYSQPYYSYWDEMPFANGTGTTIRSIQ